MFVINIRLQIIMLNIFAMSLAIIYLMIILQYSLYICYSGKKEPADVLNDIGNMLANLTDELDAMLEEEKRQGLND